MSNVIVCGYLIFDLYLGIVYVVDDIGAVGIHGTGKYVLANGIGIYSVLGQIVVYDFVNIVLLEVIG